MTKRISRLLFLIHNKTLLKTIKNHFFHKKMITAQTFECENIKANQILNYEFDCSRPRSFNEFICWMKIKYYNELWCKCADKLASKDFLINHGFGKYVVKTYKKYNSSDEINLNELPERFVLKTNHDSGSVFICDKKTTDFKSVFKKLDSSLLVNYCRTTGEWVYNDIKPVIFAEELLEPNDNKSLVDYKFFSFNGEFGWGFTGQNRLSDTRFVVFERGFNIQNVEYIYLRPNKKSFPKKPHLYNEMEMVSEELSKILDFVRVDFYDTTHGLKIGELTFFSQSGNGPFTKKEYDFKYGELFKKTKMFDTFFK